MRKRPGRRKHIPQRTCVVCRTVRSKRDLVRVVRSPEGIVTIDESGKQSGRGAYVCRQQRCWEKALVGRHLERALKSSLTVETKAQLRHYAITLPPTLIPSQEAGGQAMKGAGLDE